MHMVLIWGYVLKIMLSYDNIDDDKTGINGNNLGNIVM